jgi:3-deoxy-D-manno-octulosonic-acid transferase
VAGSTGDGEDGAVLDAFLKTRGAHPDLFLILAPRHPQRADDVAREAESRGLRLHRLSGGDDASAGRADGLLVDAVGELGQLYALARAAFVGGSLVPVGGHNVLEPAALGVPVLFGPHTHHVSDPADSLVTAGGAWRVRDAEELATAWTVLVDDDRAREEMARRATAVIEASRGALGRSVDLILSALDGGPASRPE